jgi:hypothetical protein
MRSLHVAVGLMSLASMSAACGIWVNLEGTAPAPYAHFRQTATSVPGANVADEPRVRDRVVDKYGNQIERAVGDYRIDTRGWLYERHAPLTAVPKLTPPST